MLLTAAFELVGQKQKAIESYTKAGLWRECLNIAYSIPMPAKDLAELATQLAESLVERRQFVDAARLYIDYGTSDTAIEKAVNALAKGYHFTEAIRVVILSPLFNINFRSTINMAQKRLQRLFIPR